MSHAHSHSHGDGGAHGHSHTGMDKPGVFHQRPPIPHRHDYHHRAFTVGIGGPVGSGKTALVYQLCQLLHTHGTNSDSGLTESLIVVTNDIFTREDMEFLHRREALGAGNNDRIRAVETGGCPHAAIREDCSANLQQLIDLTAKFAPSLAIVESGGDNLAAQFSRELADYIIYVVDVAGGDKVPRKGGPGVTESDLLIINKTDLAQAVGADLVLMESQARDIRGGGPVVMAQIKHGVGVVDIAAEIIRARDDALQEASATHNRQ